MTLTQLLYYDLLVSLQTHVFVLVSLQTHVFVLVSLQTHAFVPCNTQERCGCPPEVHRELTVTPLTVPISSLMVKMSSRACVGCSPVPSPALITGLRETRAAFCPHCSSLLKMMHNQAGSKIPIWTEIHKSGLCNPVAAQFREFL